MTTRLEIEVGGAAGEKWSPIRLNAAGEPVFVSNGAKIGTGVRVVRVTRIDPPFGPDQTAVFEVFK